MSHVAAVGLGVGDVGAVRLEPEDPVGSVDVEAGSGTRPG